MLHLKEQRNYSLKIKRNKHLAKEFLNNPETFRRNQGKLYLVNYTFLLFSKIVFPSRHLTFDETKSKHIIFKDTIFLCEKN